MTERRPPFVAAWLLRRIPNEPLAGDLLEGFRNGRAPGWFWRQTLLAVITTRLATREGRFGVFSWAVQLIFVLWVRTRHIAVPSEARLFLCLMVMFAIVVILDRTRLQEGVKNLFIAPSAVIVDCVVGLLWHSMAGDSAFFFVVYQAICLWQHLWVPAKARMA